MATRYTDKTKKEVVAFVKKHDEENGRGGQSAAKKKYGINPISIKKWCVEQGYATASTTAKKKKPAAKKKAAPKTAKAAASKSKGAKRGPKPGRKAGRKPAADAASPSTPGTVAKGTTATLNKMSTISAKIESLQEEFDSLKASL